MGRQLLIALILALGAESPEGAPEKPRDQADRKRRHDNQKGR